MNQRTWAKMALTSSSPRLGCSSPGFVALVASLWSAASALGGELPAPIDRHALATRHNVVLRQFDPENPLTLGNGEFAFTADATGLQTFPDAFTNTIPLGTLSQWGWHTEPNPNGWSLEKFQFKEFEVFGRKVEYADVPGNKRTPEINWLRANPHRLHLGQVGFLLKKADGSLAQANDLISIEQTLDLWNGVLRSRFRFDGEAVEVETVCHPARDLITVRVKSPLVKSGRLGIQMHFPYGTGSTVTADWTKPEAHETKLSRSGKSTAAFTRRLDNDTYDVRARWSKGATLREVAQHKFVVAAGVPPAVEPGVPPGGKSVRSPNGSGISSDGPGGKMPPSPAGGTPATTLEFVCEFSPKPVTKALPSFGETLSAVRGHWNKFWSTGGAIDLSQSQDPRWRELERRIVLSQYLTAIQCAGTLPPQETGLTYNSWEGKFHLEMHWWHAAHFALWNRLPMLERSLGYYERIRPRAQATATRQGYTGARWPKMTGPTGAESPSPVGPFLIWQQPHPIFYAELCYREHRDHATLKKFEKVVMETAEFMASYPEWDEKTKRFVLGPVLQCAQELFPKDKTLNPTFELTYWRWGLETAQRWRERLGLKRVEKWDRVLKGLAKPALEQGKYLFAETAPGTYTNRKWIGDHPTVLAALCVLPGPGVDYETMRRTLAWIWANWNWPDTWGWDYGMVAMTAARLSEPERAVEALLLDTPKNHYRLNGHNHQRPGLTIYLPGNGSLLYATAMMCAGWDSPSLGSGATSGAPKTHAPGFPDNGQWVVRWENLRPAP